MSAKKSRIKNLIRDYLLDEGILREKITDSKIDFGFKFSFPPGPKGQGMSIFKPKDKDFIIILIRIQISESQAKILSSLEENKKIQFFMDLRKYFIIKEVFYRIDVQNYRYEITNQIFLKNDEIISKNSIFKRIRKLYFCFMFSTTILQEYCSGKEMPSKKFVPDFDLSLYS